MPPQFPWRYAAARRCLHDQGETLLGCGVWGYHPVQLPQEWKSRRWLTFEQQEHDREVELLHPPVERFVVLHRLPRADALLANQQDEGCCLGDFLGKLRQPEAARTQALGRVKETRIGVLAPQRRFKRLHQRKVLRIVTQKPAPHSKHQRRAFACSDDSGHPPTGESQDIE